MTFKIPDLLAMYSFSERERPLLEKIAGQEVRLGEDQLEVFYGIDISGFTKPVRDQLKQSGQPYLTIALEGITDWTVSPATQGEYALPPCFRVQCLRDSVSFGETALNEFHSLLVPQLEVDRLALPISLLLERRYFESFEREFLEALRARLPVPIEFE